MMITRKEFLKYAAILTGGMSLSDKLRFTAELEAASLAPQGRALISVLLEGGPDFRHIFVPKPNSDPASYGYKYWNNRTETISRATAKNDFNSWNNAYARDFQEITLNGQTFGVMKGDSGTLVDYNGWLISKIQAGQVAIICNVKHATSRDHSNALMVAQTGLYQSSPMQTSVSGWGGLLINSIDSGTTGAARLLSMTYGMRQFCSSSGNNKAVSFSDSRMFGLTRTADLGTESNNDLRFKRARALETYLKARNTDAVMNPLYTKFTAQHAKLLALTNSVKSVLNTSNPQPEAITNLYARTNGTLKNFTFGKQIANLYDALQTGTGLNMRIASLAYGGWDSHKNQKTDIEPQFNDLFGTGKAFDLLFSQAGGTSVFNSSVLMFYGDFGRQLKANADGGTDHGRGNYIVLIGGKVKGGIYGTMFPTVEINKYDNYNRDIDTSTANAYTSFDSLYNKVGDWVNNDSAVSLSLNSDSNVDKSGGLDLSTTALFNP